jgi:multicomponent Na+:H+ antiporter subunit D
MNILILLPVIVPLITIAIGLFTRGSKGVQQIFGIGGIAIQLIVAISIFQVVSTQGIQVVQLGNWPAPFGITFVADLFSAIMLIMSGIIGLVIAIYSISTIDKFRQRFSFFPLVNALLMGVNGAFLTGDVFNLYVWFEVMILASFVLLTMGGSRKQMDGAVKYVSMNLIASMMFLAGIGLLYGKAGTLNMADLAVKIGESDESLLLNSSAMLFFVAFSIKAAVFPFFFWLPASYHTPPIAITALFAGLLTKVGVYAMIRFFTLFFVQNQSFWHPLLLIIGGLTMVVGVLTAASQYDMRKILSFHIISQIGYMVMGLGLFTVLGVAGAIFYMVHNIIAKTNTFLIAGIVHRIKGSYDLKSIGGLYKLYPFLALLFLIAAFGLAGIPPLSGFAGKLLLIIAGFEDQNYVITGVAILVGLFTLFSMVKIWNEGFWKKQPEGTDEVPKQEVPFSMYLPVILLAAGTIVLGLFAEPFIKIGIDAAEQLINPENYINTVLGR